MKPLLTKGRPEVWLVLLGALLVLGWLLWSLLGEAVGEELALRPDDRALVERGAALYASECASCHGESLQGQANWRQRKADGRLPAPPHDASGHTWHHPDAQLIALTKQGPAALVGGNYQSDMLGYEDKLSDEEIVAVLSYIKSTWPVEVRERHDDINARSQ